MSTNSRIRTDPNTNNYMFSVILSWVPPLMILLFYLVIKASLASIDYFPGAFMSTLIVACTFVVCNIMSYSILAPVMLLKIYWRSSVLTNAFLVGFLLANQSSFESLVVFGYYFMCLSLFHLSEFVFTALFNSREVTTDSFLLNHSMEYGLAALASWVEFFLEAMIIPSLKMSLYTRYIGLTLILFGEAFRKLAMYTAGTNFNHYVQERRHDDHVLVTRGVYSLVRHPSYFGWFYWSVGTQILLANPICTVLYTIASYRFFATRITFEEFHLLKFFGKQYSAYQQRVPSGIPFVKGFIQPDESLD